MIAPDSHQVSRVRCYLGTPTLSYLDFEYTTFTLFGRPFQAHSSIFSLKLYGSRNPVMQARRFRLFPFRSPLLRESHSIYFPPGTKMFQFPGLPTSPLTWWVYRISPFGHPRIKACLAAPRGLSQPTTSFFGHISQGIHRKPLNEI